MDSFLAFFSVSVVVIVTPGPDAAVTIPNTLIGGRSGGVLTALGIASGQTIWAVYDQHRDRGAAVASAPLFLTAEYAGAAYLASRRPGSARGRLARGRLGAKRERLGQKRIEPIANDVDDHPL